MHLYLIGSLRNPGIPAIATQLRDAGHVVFDEWYAAGSLADDAWRDYEQGRGWTYQQAIRHSLAAQHVFLFDYMHLQRCDAAVLILPAGRSGHLELGWAIGQGKKGYILLDDPERFDVMYKFATDVYTTVDELVEGLSGTNQDGCRRTHR